MLNVFAFTDVSVRDSADGRTPLLWACLIRNKKTAMKIAQILLEEGSSVQEQDHGGNTALLLATAVGNKKIVKYLLSDPPSSTRSPVNVNQKNAKGYTALVIAIQVSPTHHTALPSHIPFLMGMIRIITKYGRWLT